MQFRVCGAEAVGFLAAHHVGTQPDGGNGEPVFRLDVGEGIEVVRLCHAADFRVIAPVMLVADHFLQDYRHFLFLDHVVDGVEVRPRLGREDGGVHQLDSVFRVPRPSLEVRVIVRQEVGGVHAGKGLVERVLEQPGGAYRQRFGHHAEVFPQFCPQFLRQSCRPEGVDDVVVLLVGVEDVVKVVLLDKVVKFIDADHRRFGYHHLQVGNEFFKVHVLDEVGEERQPASLAAERAFAEAGNVAVGVYQQRVEVDDASPQFFQFRRLEDVGDEAARFLRVFEIAETVTAQFFGEVDFRPRHEPRGDAVALGVVF